MKVEQIAELWNSDDRLLRLLELIKESPENISVSGLPGSSMAFVLNAISLNIQKNIFIVQRDKESALHLMNDLEMLCNDEHKDVSQKKILFFPPSYKNPYDFAHEDHLHQLYRSNVIHRLTSERRPKIIVCTPESFIEPVMCREEIEKASFQVSTGESVSMDFMIEMFDTYGFTNVDFVYEPGQFAVRGGIIDVFAFSYDHPYRIEFSGDEISGIRSFDPYTQNSVAHFTKIMILSNVGQTSAQKTDHIFRLIPASSVFWTIPEEEITALVRAEWEKYAESDFGKNLENSPELEMYLTEDKILNLTSKFTVIENAEIHPVSRNESIDFGIHPPPYFARNFDVLFSTLMEYKTANFKTLIFSENKDQIKRMDVIIEDIEMRENSKLIDAVHFIDKSLHGGFIDPVNKIAVLTDHQIFEKYHRYKFAEKYPGSEVMTLRDLRSIHPGDYIVHMDYGVGQYAGLEMMDVQGKQQEAIRIVYKNNDLLYVSIHSLHKITKFTGKEGTEPQLDKIGSGSWQQKKYRAKAGVKDIARDLIKLYASRKDSKGFSFSADTYLQYELEASFIYEDTEDQLKATQDVKADMEASFPMDRLICGDVGFGKTEVAIRAAFKAAVSGKQTVILVPTTILALQHYHTFKERLKEFPVEIEYLNRFRSVSGVRDVLKKLRSGAVDIIIGTHKLLGKDIEFKDLGLLVIDEEQKFGVAAKEKIRQLKVNVDTLTMTATPIPRTLQFSLLGARDLSVINTPPPNRYPVHTELLLFNARRIAEIIMYEVNRGGQVFFVNNKILNINEVAGMIRKICPGIRVEIGHGQMDGKELEKVVLDFIEGKFDVFVSTSIVESGIDIPNANTMIINDAHHFGLSDLHQLRGRVGRSNKKAFCYLISPPLVTLSEQSRKRLKALIELSELGSGFQISMRDLDIRGAGNLLGGEQSGFISEIGYEMYQKILDEALFEVRLESQSPEIDFEDPSTIVRDCQLDTDMSLLIPEAYVSNINERLMLYKDLDSFQNEKQLNAFVDRLHDRFGDVPQQTIELIEAVRLRWLGRKAGIVKIILKGAKMTVYFLETTDEAFFQSTVYSRILQYVMSNPKSCLMKQSDKGQMYIIFNTIGSVPEAVLLLKSILDLEIEEKSIG